MRLLKLTLAIMQLFQIGSPETQSYQILRAERCAKLTSPSCLKKSSLGPVRMQQVQRAIFPLKLFHVYTLQGYSCCQTKCTCDKLPYITFMSLV